VLELTEGVVVDERLVAETDGDLAFDCQQFADEFGARFTIGWDADKSVAKNYNPPTMPSSFVIDRNGHVRFEHAGYHDGDELEIEKEVTRLLRR